MKRIELTLATCVLLAAIACNDEKKPTEAPTSAASAASPAANTASTPPAPGGDGPVVEVRGSVITVDGTAAGNTGAPKLDELSKHLVTTRETWTKLHPNETFPGRCVIKADKATSPDVVARITQTARDAGYPSCTAR